MHSGMGSIRRSSRPASSPPRRSPLRISPDELAMSVGRALETVGAWLLGLLWVLPLAYAFWTAFHPSEFSTRFVLTAPLTLENFAQSATDEPRAGARVDAR